MSHVLLSSTYQSIGVRNQKLSRKFKKWCKCSGCFKAKSCNKKLRKMTRACVCFPVSVCIGVLQGNMESNENDCNDEKCGLEESRKEYNIGILKQVQAIFGHLAYSKLQYYVPRGLWKHFK